MEFIEVKTLCFKRPNYSKLKEHYNKSYVTDDIKRDLSNN